MNHPRSNLLVHLGGDSFFPLDIATESLAIIARKGAGKTHTGRCVAEDMIVGGVQAVVIDPLDVWWGLRVDVDGKGSGLNVVIFGGAHADLPLVATSGPALADLIVDKGINAVLVLDGLTQGEQFRFMAEFGVRLYERKGEQQHRTPMHILIDEADEFISQKPFPEALRCQGAWDRVVRRGRSRGLGTTLITQRPAAISKNVLTQTEVMIVLQVTGPQDRKALQEWIDANATKEESKEFLGSLASMQRGDAWVWSPAKLKCFYRVKIRQTRTFDSSFTPAVGKTRVTPKLKDLDLTAIRAGLETVIAEAEANDPKALKARIKELEKLVGKPVVAAARVTIPEAWSMCSTYIKAAIVEAVSARDAGWCDKLHNLSVTDVPFDISRWMDLKKPDSVVMHYPSKDNAADRKVTEAYQNFDDLPKHKRPRLPAPARGGDKSLPKAERAILTALAQFEDGLPADDLAVIAGYSPKGGGFLGPMKVLREKGYITSDKTGGDGYHITDEGLKALGPYEKLPTGSDLLDYWVGRLGAAEGKILTALRFQRDSMAAEALAEATGYAAKGGGFLGPLKNLRIRRLISTDRGIITLSDNLKD